MKRLSRGKLDHIFQETWAFLYPIKLKLKNLVYKWLETCNIWALEVNNHYIGPILLSIKWENLKFRQKMCQKRWLWKNGDFSEKYISIGWSRINAEVELRFKLSWGWAEIEVELKSDWEIGFFGLGHISTNFCSDDSDFWGLFCFQSQNWQFLVLLIELNIFILYFPTNSYSWFWPQFEFIYGFWGQNWLLWSW